MSTLSFSTPRPDGEGRFAKKPLIVIAQSLDKGAPYKIRRSVIYAFHSLLVLVCIMFKG
jgi:hypothetical protein